MTDDGYDYPGLVRALLDYRQVDEDGTDCGVSRQAVEEAAAIIPRLRSAISQRDSEIALLRRALTELVTLRSEAEHAEPLTEGRDIAAIVKWRDRWVAAFASARAAIAKGEGT